MVGGNSPPKRSITSCGKRAITSSGSSAGSGCGSNTVEPARNPSFHGTTHSAYSGDPLWPAVTPGTADRSSTVTRVPVGSAVGVSAAEISPAVASSSVVAGVLSTVSGTVTSAVAIVSGSSDPSSTTTVPVISNAAAPTATPNQIRVRDLEPSASIGRSGSEIGIGSMHRSSHRSTAK